MTLTPPPDLAHDDPIEWRFLQRAFGDGDTTRGVLIERRPRKVGHRLGIATLTWDWDKGAPIRLTWVDTVERGDPDYYLWKGRLATWLTEHEPYLVATTYRFDSLGRYLGDIWDSRTGESASQHMLALGAPLWKDH